MAVAVIMRMAVVMMVVVMSVIMVVMMMVTWCQHMLVLVGLDGREARGGVMIMFMCVMVVVIRRPVVVHAELGGVDAVLEHFLGGDGVAFDAQGLKAFFDGVEIGARIDEGTHGHVAADAAEAVEVTGFHGVHPGGWASWVIGLWFQRICNDLAVFSTRNTFSHNTVCDISPGGKSPEMTRQYPPYFAGQGGLGVPPDHRAWIAIGSFV